MKPPSPLLAPEQEPLKPTTPLQPKNTPKNPFLTRKGDGGFSYRSTCARKGDSGFRQAGRLVYRTQMRYPWAATGPGRATNGQPTLQTSSNRRYSNRLARTPVTNVVNLSRKISVFGEKALGLTTFVTPGQNATQKTPWIDDVCNNTHQTTPKTQRTRPPRCPQQAAGPGQTTSQHTEQHQRPGTTGVEGAGGTGGHG